MKKANVFGAMLCSAALAMGMAMPAFAVGASTDGTATASGNNGTASTSVKMSVTDSSISATVPLNLFVVSPSAGGALSVPTTYQIENTGATSVYVSKVKTVAKMGWNFSTASGINSLTTGNNVEMSFNGDDGKTNFTLDGAKGAAGKTFSQGQTTVLTAATPAEGSNPAVAGGAIKFVLSGSTKVVTPLSTASDTASEIATVEFTIATTA